MWSPVCDFISLEASDELPFKRNKDKYKTFSLALEKLKEGYKIKRKSWYKGQLIIKNGSIFIINERSPWFCSKWKAKSKDLLADDWEIII